MTRKFMLILVAIALLSSGFAESESALTTIILVRHAEKTKVPENDPVLTEAGKSRAELLAKMLGNAGVKAIYTTKYQRNKLTAEPLARKLAIEPIVLDANNSENFAKSIKSKNLGQTVLVVGHSNTVPEIIHALGGPLMEEIDETEYDNFFVVTITDKGTASLLKLKY